MGKDKASDPGSSVTVGLADMPVAGANGNRSGIHRAADPRNTARIWLRKAASGATVGTGIPLVPGAVHRDERRPTEIYYGPYCAIAEADGQRIAKVEE